MARENVQQAKRNASWRITSLKKWKDLHVMSEDNVLVAMKILGNNNQEKQVRRQKRE